MIITLLSWVNGFDKVVVVVFEGWSSVHFLD